MAPSSFFKAGNHLGTTLLDQASFNLPKHRLTFHYRSQQKDLIQFSNEHFYQNKLTVLPTYPKEKSIYSYPVVEGIYEDGSNIEEAKLACKLLLERIGIINNRVGLVAFSEKQLRAINALFTPSERQKIDIAQAKGQLFLKTVEQIQGDECDEIIISSNNGSLVVRAKLSDDVHVDSVSVAHGKRDANVSVLTSRFDVDNLTGMVVQTAIPVTVKKLQ